MTRAFVPPPPTYRPIAVSSGIRAAANRAPGKVAIVEGERQLTYRALVERIGRVGSLAMAGLRFEPGQTAAIVAPNCLEYMELVSGLSDAGVAVATLSPRQTATELSYILDDCGARVVFATPATEALVRDACGASVERVIAIGPEYESLLAAASPAPSLPRIQEWEPFSIPYTSGTTGKPRGVTLPHRSRVMSFFGMAVEFGCYSPDDRYLAFAPIFHGAGYSFAQSSIFFGGTLEIMPAFDAELVLRALQRSRATGVFMVPTHFHAIFALGAELRARHRDFALRAIISNAAPLAQRTKELIVDYFGEGLLHECYGSTEGAIVTNLRPQDQLRKVQCVGTPFACTEVKLLDDAGNPVKPGNVGELYSLSPYIFNGYWRNPQATASCLRDGWVSAGDLARTDEEGFFYIVDRKKDMYISGGVNVFPREVEELLFRYPGVKEVGIVGVPDDYWGEVGRAFIVKQPGADIDPEAVLAHCKEKLAGYKVPRSVSFIEALPRNAAGKVLKTELRKLT